MSETQTELYRYDSAQRLVRWVHGADSASWSYDQAGNRTGQSGRVPLAGLRVDSYTYGGTSAGGPNRLADVITQDSAGAVTGLREFSYNANGSTTARTTRPNTGGAITSENHLAYSYRELTRQYIDGSPSSPTRFDWRYRYSAGGEREQKRLVFGPNGEENGNTYPWVYYLLGGSKEQLALYHGQQTRGLLCSDTTRAVYFYPSEYITTGLGYTGAPEAISPLITAPDGTKRYRISDHLASLRVELGLSGPGHYDYDPWGEPIAVPAVAVSHTTHNNAEQDRESGDYSSGVRQSDPRSGRFNSVDVLAEKQPGASPYTYCGNNPLRYTDPTGKQQRTVQVPFQDGGPGVPSGGVSPEEAYLSYHPEIGLEAQLEAEMAERQIAQEANEASLAQRARAVMAETKEVENLGKELQIASQEAAAQVRAERKSYATAAQYGTAVHSKLKQIVDARNRSNLGMCLPPPSDTHSELSTLTPIGANGHISRSTHSFSLSTYLESSSASTLVGDYGAKKHGTSANRIQSTC